MTYLRFSLSLSLKGGHILRICSCDDSRFRRGSSVFQFSIRVLRPPLFLFHKKEKEDRKKMQELNKKRTLKHWASIFLDFPSQRGPLPHARCFSRAYRTYSQLEGIVALIKEIFCQVLGKPFLVLLDLIGDGYENCSRALTDEMRANRVCSLLPWTAVVSP